MTKKIIFSLFMLLGITLINTTYLQAQDNDSRVFVITTLKLNPASEMTFAQQDSMLNEQLMMDKQNKYIVSTQLMRHYYGSDSRDAVIIREYKSFSDIDKAGDEQQKLVEKKYPKEADRMAANKKFRGSVSWHKDEIYMSIPSN